MNKIKKEYVDFVKGVKDDNKELTEKTKKRIKHDIRR